MSGHSHWASIKHKKGLQDARKGKIFSNIAKLIMQAAREGGKDIESNAKLRLAVDKARQVNMPKDNVERAILKGVGELPGSRLEDVTFEGYGPGGVSIVVNCLTDNKKRTHSEIKKIFDTRGGSLGEANCVGWLFETKGYITIPANSISEENLMTLALDSGADDVQTVVDCYEVITSPKDFDKVVANLKGNNVQIKTSEITKIPKSYMKISGELEKKVLDFVDLLEEHDDVQEVYANFELSTSE